MNPSPSSAHDSFPEFDSLSLPFVERIYRDYVQDPASVASDWRVYFERASNGQGTDPLWPKEPPRFDRSRPSPVPERDGNGKTRDLHLSVLQERVGQLIRNYRVRGHIMADLDPLGQPHPHPPELDPAYYGFREADYERPFAIATADGEEILTFREILERLQNTYCRRIGVQFMHIDDLEVRQWLQSRMERSQNRLELSRKEQFRILRMLTDAVVFEEYIQSKYVGAKSFSLEGAESLMPLLHMTIEQAGEQGIAEIVMGMAHRGRLNVLANIVGKSARQIFREFEDRDPNLYLGRGDVKYHLGYSTDWTTSTGKSLHISLCFNPSHLEFVNPVAMGRLRAKQDRFGDEDRKRGLLLLIHGDAAFAGEGIIQETLNLSELKAYRTGGAIHVVVNNQIGFTTGTEQARSSVYATDVAKMLQIPIFHVNGEDPEAVAQVVRLAMDFRREYARDVVIDMYCYRLHGHNEADEPAFTQPILYQAIKRRDSVQENYGKRLVDLGNISQEEVERIIQERQQHFDNELKYARSEDYKHHTDTLGGIWQGYKGGKDSEIPDVETGVERDRLSKLLESQTRLPDGFHPHAKIARGLERRRKMAEGQEPLDWAAGEALAYASLATDGYRVRLTGQDSERGTFSHRHAVLHDTKNGQIYVPLQNLSADQAPVEIYNSPLSEAGVLGFEYGYSLDSPDSLVLWEAQFGDFINAAQVIIDQFLVSAEDKWNRLSGLTLLLPHGFEGQGPEHSSARLERMLMVAAEDNIQIVVPTTPGQFFHVLRRQVLRRWRKPLIVFTPKSLLRHSDAVSTLEELSGGRFLRVIPDERPDSKNPVRRVLLCSGKLYYELRSRREAEKHDDVAIVRIEQLYPWPEEELQQALAAIPDETPAFWVQEEPANMGAWWFLKLRFGERLFDRFPFAGITRPESSSPATGSKTSHKLEQDRLLDQAFEE